MIIASPMNEEELRNMMYTAQLPRKSKAMTIRYPRGSGVMPEWQTTMKAIEIGKGRKLRDGEEIAFLTIGHIGNYATIACDRAEENDALKVAHYDARFAKPLDEEMLHEICTRYKAVITVEDGTVTGGFGSAVAEFISEHNYNIKLIRKGIPDRIVEHGTQSELHKECGFDPEGLYETLIGVLETKPQ